MLVIKLYTTSTCVYCRLAKNFLDKNLLAYQEFNLEYDVRAREEVLSKLGELSVPILDIDGEIFVGFDPSGLKQTLNLS